MCQNGLHRHTVECENAPKAIGPYAQAIIAGGFVYTSGQLPINPETNVIDKNDVRGQSARVLENLKSILEESGSNLSHVIKTTVFLKDMNTFSEFNEVYGEYFGSHPPARSCVEVARLPKDALVEIEAVSILED